MTDKFLKYSFNRKQNQRVKRTKNIYKKIIIDKLRYLYSCSFSIENFKFDFYESPVFYKIENI